MEASAKAIFSFPLYWEINKAEFNPNIIRLGTGELSPDLFPREMMNNFRKTKVSIG
jgi:hypothetical protein